MTSLHTHASNKMMCIPGSGGGGGQVASGVVGPVGDGLSVGCGDVSPV